MAQLAYIAEGVMVREGQQGKKWRLTKGHRDDPQIQAETKAISEFATQAGRTVGYGDWIKVYASDYILDLAGKDVLAECDMNRIVVRYQTDDLTILHEVAHMATNTFENTAGHNEAWCKTAHELYSRFISKEAGVIFWGVMETAFD